MLTPLQVKSLYERDLLKEVVQQIRLTNRDALVKMNHVIPMGHLHGMISRLDENGIEITAEQLDMALRLHPKARAALIDDYGTDVGELVLDALAITYLGCPMVKFGDGVDYEMFMQLLNNAIHQAPL